MTTILHHLDPATLMSFAAGTLAEPLAAVVAAHIDMCGQCRDEIAHLEVFGAMLLADVTPVGGGATSVSMLQQPASERRASIERPADPAGILPLPLASAYRLSFETIPWKRLGPGVRHHRLPLSRGVTGDLRLLEIGAGRAMPSHGHGGSELTLVLSGAFSDETGAYRRGDVQDVDETIGHTPIADEKAGCVCLIASERPARFKSFVGRLMQPWTGM